ncbi:putative mannosyltransferase KTR3 [Smittium mucronatum]|uniref:Putative mannosyltransferase KTR3 n=1 Tax=Smittium mucronatum TaxID=133383 RepID=A0A1R0GZ24_9FUNG|nr:putative mannosyltransferase KTR3 [Smittium mucronatum]OLY82127.1 putative mannosyltransferase KTR3 [Smittium mucronatum]
MVRVYKVFAITSFVVFFILYFLLVLVPFHSKPRLSHTDQVCLDKENCGISHTGDIVLEGILKISSDKNSNSLNPGRVPKLTSKDFQFSVNTLRVDGIPENIEEVDYSNLTLNFTRLNGWPSAFPHDLESYRQNVLKTTYFNKNTQWVQEIAPYTWHHRGKAEDYYINHTDSREKAAILVLVRNKELNQILHSMRQLEDRFNRKNRYPYIFLNDKPFSNKFMEFVARATDSNTTFSIIPKEHWSVPSDINMKKVKSNFKVLDRLDIPYAKSMSYRHMCRFNSGFFYKHPLLHSLKYYWRLEPDIDFYCDLKYDPFTFMRKNGKLYSFVVSLLELEMTIPTLWEHTLSFANATNLSSTLFSMFAKQTKPYPGKFKGIDSSRYNLCHFWSNFEIASLDFYRSPEYQQYFDYLDSTGNFFYERWGDAPIHSLAVGLFLNYNQLHFFNDIGYRHDTFARWPEPKVSIHNSCVVPKSIKENFDKADGSCLKHYLSYREYNWDRSDSVNGLLRLRRDRW